MFAVSEHQPLRPYIAFLIKNKVLRFPQFRNYLALRFSIILSLNMQTTIISYMVYQLTKDSLSLGLIGLWEVIPAFGFSMISGHFVDQREKKGLMVQCIIGYMLLSLFYGMLSLRGFQQMAGVQLTVWLIYGGIFISGMLRAFLSPTNFSIFGLILPKTQYANATTWSSAAWQSGAVLGPLIGGMLLAWTGFEISLFSVFLVQIVPLIAILSIPKLPILNKEKEPILKSLKSGLSFVFHSQMILAALALDMFAVLFGGAVALLPVYATDILKVGEVGYGWLRAAPGIGALITLMILSMVPIKTNAGLKLLASIALFGVTTIVFGISTNFALSFAMLLLGGMFDSVSVIIRSTILQLYTPDEMRGRVAAVNTMFVSSSNELGALESGVTAKWLGTVPAVVFGGCMTILIVAATYLKAPRLRTLRLDGGAKDKT
ncbi:MAG: MFS transporter [Sphingobacteriales bacterium]|nr:MAG: MFS transporter [Sphingobacteriales bacterium]